MKKIKLYVSGPMRGIEAFNFPAFESASRALRDAGYDVVSPHEVDLEHGFDPTTSEDPEGDQLAEMLARDAAAIAGCDGLALLRDWRQSSGARWEVDLAKMTGKTAQSVENWLVAGIDNPPRIFGLTGPKGVGKRKFADGFWQYNQVSFADPIRALAFVTVGYVSDDEYYDVVSQSDVVLPILGCTPNDLMNAVRGCFQKFDPNLLVKIMEYRLNSDEADDGYDGKFIVDDVRLPREAEMIRRLGGEVWRVSRKGFEDKEEHDAIPLPDSLVDREVEL